MIRHLAAAGLLLALSACSHTPTGPDVVGGGNPYIPNFTFVWQNQADSTHQYQFFTDTTNVTSGTFSEGSSERFEGRQNALTGTFNGRSLTFTVQRQPGATPTTVTGQFVNDDTIRLTWGTTTVTIVRIRNV